MSHTCSMEPQKPTLFSEVSQAFLEHTEKCRYYKVIDQMSEFILESLVYWVEKFFLRSGAYVYARVCVRQKKKRGRERENFYQRKFFVEFFYLFFSILCTIFLISFENLNIHYLKSVFFQLPYTMSKVLCIMLWFNILCFHLCQTLSIVIISCRYALCQYLKLSRLHASVYVVVSFFFNY